ncbi:MAG: FAD-dependent oxidoreductase [Deltaproteobacteria bacterium]|nr:FAD-dependent oxidoreductase [Deltaproteobacteria bacterium]
MNKPLWADGRESYGFPRLERKCITEVCVVGAGIAGLTTAVQLARAGRKVVLLDKGSIAGGETGCTTAHITEVLDMRYADLISKFGMENTRQVRASSRAAMDLIAQFVKELNIQCAHQSLSGYLYTELEEDVGELEDELAAMESVGIEAHLKSEIPLPFPIKTAIEIADQAQFDPLAYCSALAEEVIRHEGHIFTDTAVKNVQDRQPCIVQTGMGEVIADAVAICTHVPVINRLWIHTKIAPYRSYVVAAPIEGLGDPPSLFWDTAQPYHFTRMQKKNGTMYLIVGGEDHKTGQIEDTASCYFRLREYLWSRFGIRQPQFQWSGQMIEPIDGLPFIGKNAFSQQVYIATGFSGTGITFGTLGGMLIAEEILGIQNSWQELFRATRKSTVAGSVNFISENVDYPINVVKQRLESRPTANEVNVDEGKVVYRNGKKIALYRKPSGEEIALSPVCTHLGCYVNWNNAEKTWDCPCHGSRFSVEGQVINGPATAALAPDTSDWEEPGDKVA